MELQHIEHIWNLMARKLSGEASAAELVELEQLLRNQPEENYSLEVMQDLWKSQPVIDRQHSENEYRELVFRLKNLGIDEGKFDQEDHYINTINSVAAVPASRRRFLAYVAIIALLAIAGFFVFNRSGKAVTAETLSRNEISTRYGSKSSLVLPDGTKVWLNAGSKLTYDKNYGGNLREVALTGEAFFDVVKDPHKPFIIHTAKMDVKVLGTAFNVKCYPEEHKTETSLIRGSIEVTLKDRTDKIILKPNEKLIVTDSESGKKPVAEKQAGPAAPVATEEPMIVLSHLTRETAKDDYVETAWVKNRLSFEEERFEDIAVKMERWYNVKITINNEKVKSYRLTGSFENETIDEALKVLQYLVSFSYQSKGKEITINKK